jgi:hypothetical protein
MTSKSGANRAGQAAARARSSVKADADQSTGRRDGSDSAEQIKKKTVRLSLDVSVELNALIGELATDSNSTKSDVLRRAVTLLKVANDAKKQGKKVGIAERDQQLATEIIWL